MINNNAHDDDLKQITERMEQLKREIKQAQDLETQKAHNKAIGYSTKCSICNHPQVLEIEKARDDGASYQEIKERFNLEPSLMALSNHFKNHYPKKQSYKKKLEYLTLKECKRVFADYPEIKGYFYNKPLEYIEEFLTVNGFCLDGLQLCPVVKAGEIGNSSEILEKLNNIILSAGAGYIITDYEKVFKAVHSYNTCTRCHNKQLENKNELLEKLFLKILGVDPADTVSLLNLYYLNNEDINKLLDTLQPREDLKI